MDQFAFNPDIRTKEDSGVSSRYETTETGTGSHFISFFIPSSSPCHQINMAAVFTSEICTFYCSKHPGQRRLLRPREDAPTQPPPPPATDRLGQAASTGSPTSAPEGGLYFPRPVKGLEEGERVSGELVYTRTGQTPTTPSLPDTAHWSL